MVKLWSLLLAFSAVLALPDDSDDLMAKWGSQWPYSGVATFAHLPTQRCLLDKSIPFDIAVIGVPFDVAVSYRPGARFGPRALRDASMRQSPLMGFNVRAGVNPYSNWATILDCDDIPVTAVDKSLALRQMTQAYKELLEHPTTSPFETIPRLVMLGGDHSIVLPALRALKEHYGPVTVIHFDAHMDTWPANHYPSAWESDNSGDFTHGTMFWMAAEEGLLANGTCIHAGLRSRIGGEDWGDYDHDTAQGFARIHTDDIFTLGVDGIIQKILRRVPETAPVYISVDIDVLDPGLAPGTGTPEAGGWLTRELIRMIRGLEGLNIVGADLVEVSPAFDHAEQTALAGAQIVYELMTNMVKKGKLNYNHRHGVFDTENILMEQA